MFAAKIIIIPGKGRFVPSKNEVITKNSKANGMPKAYTDRTFALPFATSGGCPSKFITNSDGRQITAKTNPMSKA